MKSGYKSTAQSRRLRIARKVAGYSRSQMAAFLAVPRRQYLAYEQGAPIPAGILDVICAVTRCSRGYFRKGLSFASHRPVIHRAGNMVTRLNLCGAPCTVGGGWCLEQCEH